MFFDAALKGRIRLLPTFEEENTIILLQNITEDYLEL